MGHDLLGAASRCAWLALLVISEVVAPRLLWLGRDRALRREGRELPSYHQLTDDFTAQHMLALAAQAGGDVGTGPSSMVASAALQLGASRWAFDQGARKRDAPLSQTIDLSLVRGHEIPRPQAALPSADTR